MELLNRIKNGIQDCYIRILFKYQPKDKHAVFFYPHPNCKTDQYDIIRYHSDNVLCLINYIVRHTEYNDYSLYLVVYDMNKIATYTDYVKAIDKQIKITFIDGLNRFSVNKYAAKCSLLFTTTGGTYFKHRTLKQKVICLNYFIPFKDDYVKDKILRAETKKRNETFDNFVLTAYLPCVISSVVRSFPLEQFLTLGFCRNDIFYSQHFSIKKELSQFLGFNVNKYLVFTPTYRDYEYAITEEVQRDLFGYDDMDYELLERILFDSSCVIIAKLHPLQTNVKVSNNSHNHIVMFNDLQELGFSLYQYLSEADGLITDYTSTYFDFLHRNRPVIFNFYDFEEYKKVRGFALNPIRSFCAGYQVETSSSLIAAIKEVTDGVDRYKEDRERIKPLFDDFYDGENTKRICDLFLR